jgi:hypothetical protein
MTELVNMSQQFQGLPMGDLIGAPLGAACDAQVKLAQATADFIRTVGFVEKEGGGSETRTADFRFKRPVINPDGTHGEEEVSMEVPMLAIVKVPNLGVTTVDITFDMEVKSSFAEKTSKDSSLTYEVETGLKVGPFSMTAKVAGSVTSHSENTRTSDNSARYTVNLKAEDKGMPEGLARVMDILQTACEPRVKQIDPAEAAA